MMAYVYRMLTKHSESITFLKYVMASVLSLGVDLLVFFTLLHGSAPAVMAATVSYSCGILCHWAISTRVVFLAPAPPTKAIRHYQKILFVGSALLGLALTSAIVALGYELHIPPQYAKAGAVIASFVVTWLLRQKIVFGDHSGPTATKLKQVLVRKAKL